MVILDLLVNIDYKYVIKGCLYFNRGYEYNHPIVKYQFLKENSEFKNYPYTYFEIQLIICTSLVKNKEKDSKLAKGQFSIVDDFGPKGLLVQNFV